MTVTDYDCRKCTYKAANKSYEYCRATTVDKKKGGYIAESYIKDGKYIDHFVCDNYTTEPQQMVFNFVEGWDGKVFKYKGI